MCAHERIHHYMNNSEKKDFLIPLVAAQTTGHISKLSETSNEAITSNLQRAFQHAVEHLQ